MNRLFVALVVLVTANAAAETLVSAGYQEAVFSVADADHYAEFFEQVAGWQILHEGKVEPELLAGWGLPAAATASEIVIANPGTSRGYVRLVQFEGVQQQQIRSSAQTWDTGGFYDVNSRVLDMAQKFAELQARGWQAYSDPVQFAFGPFEVREWLARGPDGIVLALIERIRPPLEGWPQLQQMSRLFNATQIVPDLDAARHFYIDQLGFKVYLDHSGPSPAAGPNVLGMPYNLAAEIPRRITIVHPEGTNEGSIELLQFDGLSGADFAARARPPNLGILMLRFPVSDLTAFVQHMHSENIELARPVTELELAPYGRVRMIAARGPGGVWLEFFETL